MADPILPNPDPQNPTPTPAGGDPAPAPAPAPSPAPQGIPYDQYHAKLEEIKTLKAELEQLKSQPAGTFDGEYSDEGRLLLQKIEELQTELSSVKDDRELQRIYSLFPDLQALSSEFEEFRKEFPRHKLENVAKLFLSEKGLLGAEVKRKGLEQPVGGGQKPTTGAMTAEDVKRLRETNPRKYQDMVLSGQINI